MEAISLAVLCKSQLIGSLSQCVARMGTLNPVEVLLPNFML
jgi:hypothetical protein